MGFIEGDARGQGTLFPVTLEELISEDHFCRVIDAFVDRLDMQGLGFARSEAAETGRPGYDPRDLLKLYLYGYLQQIRSSRRLESECRRNLELMWLLGRLCPDHKSIAEFRRVHRHAVTQAFQQFSYEGQGRDHWVSLPFLGVDGVPKTGQAWVRSSVLAATVVCPPLSGTAMDLLTRALQTGTIPPETTLINPHSFPE